VEMVDLIGQSSPLEFKVARTLHLVVRSRALGRYGTYSRMDKTSSKLAGCAIGLPVASSAKPTVRGTAPNRWAA